MPLHDWLDDDQIIELDPHYSPREIGQFMEVVMAYHARAYGYEPGERQQQIRRSAAEVLALGIRQRRLSIRHLVRLTIEMFDLLYFYPDYAPALMLDELRKQLGT
jgi:hypothetical protein